MTKLEEAIDILTEYEEIGQRFVDNARDIKRCLNVIPTMRCSEDKKRFARHALDHLKNMEWFQLEESRYDGDSAEVYPFLDDAVKAAVKSVSRVRRRKTPKATLVTAPPKP